ncbi:extracellular solute-binding protein [Synechococcus sp. CBW1002]|jgi:ABC-type glycerol-3-phosphate transport system substrate-binding protein|uniref:extracellular solute-binding protein n=1 Tax=unclassified Synechococcus TaxID=2626047 RepID=UPI0018CF128F|nr:MULTISPECIES: extracellular solute-binding protein [unclassified Synechococcus]QPN60617.1 extracellular solute-binding protein [Synechococcus sp. CBW1002]QPN67683.1 extracellular solute-binding protein [Synechococcus sp. CBW1006]
MAERPWQKRRLQLWLRHHSPVALPLALLLLVIGGWSLKSAVQWLGRDADSASPALRSKLQGMALESLESVSGPPLRGTLYMGIVIDPDRILNPEAYGDLNKRVQSLTNAFRTVHPGVTVQVQLFRSDSVIPKLKARVRSGLGPDLLVASGLIAGDLHAMGLSDSVQLTTQEQQQFHPASLARLRLPNGRLSGVPLLYFPEVICFNRSKVKTSPATLEELLQASAEGLRVGLATNPINIYWTAGALGANQALVTVMRGKPLQPELRQRLLGWLRWLQSASLQQRVTFYADQGQVLDDFLHDRLDWISCSSTNFSTLQRQLGPRLGVATMPSGLGGEPTPISRERVMVLGKGSSPDQRRIAKAMASFAINPLIQRSMTIGTFSLLPVNRFVPPPVSSSSTLEALVESQRQSNATEPLLDLLHAGDPRLEALAQTLVQLVFGALSPEAATEALIRDLRPLPSLQASR